MKENVPLQITLGGPGHNWVVAGGDDGVAIIYDCMTGEVIHWLEQGGGGHVQIVDVGYIHECFSPALLTRTRHLACTMRRLL